MKKYKKVEYQKLVDYIGHSCSGLC